MIGYSLFLIYISVGLIIIAAMLLLYGIYVGFKESE